MGKLALLGLTRSLLLLVAAIQSPLAKECRPVKLDALGEVTVCIDENGLSTSVGSGSNKVISCPAAWEYEMDAPVPFTRVRMRVHSGGPYYVKNRLIVKACVLEPTYISSDDLDWKISRGRCSQWLDLGPMTYMGPANENC